MDLKLEIVGYNSALDLMTINGKRVKIKTDKNGVKTCEAKVDDVADIVIYKTHHYVGKAWFWWNLLYYIVSVFGIFDERFDKKFLTVDCRFRVKVSDAQPVVLKVLNFENGGKFAELETECEVEEISNVQAFDEQAKLKHKKMKKAKIATFILAVILIVILVAVL